MLGASVLYEVYTFLSELSAHYYYYYSVGMDTEWVDMNFSPFVFVLTVNALAVVKKIYTRPHFVAELPVAQATLL